MNARARCFLLTSCAFLCILVHICEHVLIEGKNTSSMHAPGKSSDRHRRGAGANRGGATGCLNELRVEGGTDAATT